MTDKNPDFTEHELHAPTTAQRERYGDGADMQLADAELQINITKQAIASSPCRQLVGRCQ